MRKRIGGIHDRCTLGRSGLVTLGSACISGLLLCDPASGRIGQCSGHRSLFRGSVANRAAHAATCPVASITQDSGPRFPVRGRHTYWDETCLGRDVRQGGSRPSATSIRILLSATESTSKLFALRCRPIHASRRHAAAGQSRPREAAVGTAPGDSDGLFRSRSATHQTPFQPRAGRQNWRLLALPWYILTRSGRIPILPPRGIGRQGNWATVPTPFPEPAHAELGRNSRRSNTNRHVRHPGTCRGLDRPAPVRTTTNGTTTRTDS